MLSTMKLTHQRRHQQYTSSTGCRRGIQGSKETLWPLCFARGPHMRPLHPLAKTSRLDQQPASPNSHSYPYRLISSRVVCNDDQRVAPVVMLGEPHGVPHAHGTPAARTIQNNSVHLIAAWACLHHFILVPTLKLIKPWACRIHEAFHHEKTLRPAMKT